MIDPSGRRGGHACEVYRKRLTGASLLGLAIVTWWLLRAAGLW